MKDLWVGLNLLPIYLLLILCYIGLAAGISMQMMLFASSGTALVGDIIALISFILFIVVIVKMIIKSIKMSISSHLLYDHPEYSGHEAVLESKNIMNKKLVNFKFILALSFIGWFLLYGIFEVIGYALISNGIINMSEAAMLSLWGGAGSAGPGLSIIMIGGILLLVTVVLQMIFLTPYINMTNVCFYEDVIGKEEETSEEQILEEPWQEE